MKKAIQLILFSFLVIISIIFYKIYCKENEKLKVDINVQEEKLNTNSESNLIQNLKYEVKLDEDNQYIITSDLSEINYNKAIGSQNINVDEGEPNVANESVKVIKIDADPNTLNMINK